MATLPSTVFHGSSASVWNMKLVPRPMPVTGCPPTAHRPLAGPVEAGHQVRVVDLPHPDGPTTAQNSPGSTVMVTSRRAVNGAPPGVANRLVTPASSMRPDRSSWGHVVCWIAQARKLDDGRDGRHYCAQSPP